MKLDYVTVINGGKPYIAIRLENNNGKITARYLSEKEEWKENPFEADRFDEDMTIDIISYIDNYLHEDLLNVSYVVGKLPDSIKIDIVDTDQTRRENIRAKLSGDEWKYLQEELKDKFKW